MKTACKRLSSTRCIRPCRSVLSCDHPLISQCQPKHCPCRRPPTLFPLPLGEGTGQGSSGVSIPRCVRTSKVVCSDGTALRRTCSLARSELHAGSPRKCLPDAAWCYELCSVQSGSTLAASTEGPLCYGWMRWRFRSHMRPAHVGMRVGTAPLLYGTGLSPLGLWITARQASESASRWSRRHCRRTRPGVASEQSLALSSWHACRPSNLLRVANSP